MNLTDFIFAPLFLPLFGSSISLFAKLLHSNDKKIINIQRIIEYCAVCIGLIFPVLSLLFLYPYVDQGKFIDVVIGSWHGSIGIVYRFDALSWIVSILGYSVAIPAWVYTIKEKPNPGFTAIFLVQTAALVATSMTVDLFNLFVCLEVMGISSYILVVQKEKPGSLLASFSYLMVSASAMIFFLLGLYGLYRLTGSVSYEGISLALRFMPSSGGSLAAVSVALITAAVAMRVAVMPLYGWLPDAHALAPHGISAVLSGVLIKTPLFALFRVLTTIPFGLEAGTIMGYAGAVTALLGVIVALSQKDAKRLLAYHSISQIGYVVAVWGESIRSGGLLTTSGVLFLSAALLHALFHALFKGLLFITIGTTTDCAGQRNVYVLRNSISLLQKTGERVPITFICFIIASLSITAIPPLNGFASKGLLTYSLKNTWQYYFLFLASIGTVASFVKLSRIYWPSKDVCINEPTILEYKSQKNRVVAQVFLALLCVLTGIFASSVFSWMYSMLTFSSYTYHFYTISSVVKTVIMLSGGVILFFIVSTKTGKNILYRIRSRGKTFDGLFVSYALGTAILAFILLSTL